MMAPSGQAPEYTHVKLMGGTKGFIVQESDDAVVIQDQNGQRQEYDRDRLHMVWARRDWSAAP